MSFNSNPFGASDSTESSDRFNGLDDLLTLIGKRRMLSKEKQIDFDNMLKDQLLTTPALGKDLLDFIHHLSLDNRKVHEKVIDTHRHIIDKLFERLDKDNLSEKEVDYIYIELRDLSEKVDKARKSWKDWVDKIGYALVGGIIVGLSGYVTSKYHNNSVGKRDVIDGEFIDIENDRT
ncbi:hypothetical protein [Bacillus tropicus]|uniref:hypothetical protein n=1 Tax=Bacillus tropicus TaxID=2026188 RepID=UPI0011AA9181|nr:hypothetical protein [Bacillus tropicus]